MEQMNLSDYSRYLEIPQTAVGIKVQNVVELPVKIQYFTVRNGKKCLVTELAKGTPVLWTPKEELGDFNFEGHWHR